MSIKDKQCKYLISIEEVVAKHSGRYNEKIDANLIEVITAIIRDTAEFSIPIDFRDRDMESGGLGSHLNEWVKKELNLGDDIDPCVELNDLIDDASMCYQIHEEFNNMICKITKSSHEHCILVEIIDDVNAFLVNRYKDIIIKEIKGEVHNPIYLEM